MYKYLAICLSFALVLVIGAPAKANDTDPTAKFIAKLGDEAISIISNSELSEDKKKSQFSSLLDNYFDVKTIGRFAMGRHWRDATEEQRDEYLKLFKEMVLDVYSKRFSDYTNEKLEVLKAEKINDRDTIVKSQVVFGNNRPPLVLDWRVRDKQGQSRIIDLSVEGVSMSVTQRSDFSSIIQRNGEVEALLSELRKRY